MEALKDEMEIALERVQAQKAAEAEKAKLAENNANAGQDNNQNQDAAKDEAERLAAQAAIDAKAEQERIAAEAEAERLKLEQKQPEEKKEFNEEEWLEKKTAGKYKKWEDLEAQINKEVKPEFASPFIEKLNEARKKGISEELFVKTQMTDYTKVSDIDKVKHGLQMENPDLSNEDIEVLISSKYNTNAEEVPENIARLNAVLLKQDAKKYEKSLIENQIKVLDITVDPKIAEAEAARSQREKEQQDYELDWKTKSAEALKEFKELRAKIGEADQDKISVALDPKELKAIEEIALEPAKLLSLFRKENGEVDHKKFIEAIAMIRNSDAVNAEIVKSAKAKAIDDHLKKVKNVDFTGQKGHNADVNKTEKEENLKALAPGLY